jgi:hypothetical protein
MGRGMSKKNNTAPDFRLLALGLPNANGEPKLALRLSAPAQACGRPDRSFVRTGAVSAAMLMREQLDRAIAHCSFIFVYSHIL